MVRFYFSIRPATVRRSRVWSLLAVDQQAAERKIESDVPLLRNTAFANVKKAGV